MSINAFNIPPTRFSEPQTDQSSDQQADIRVEVVQAYDNVVKIDEVSINVVEPASFVESAPVGYTAELIHRARNIAQAREELIDNRMAA
ncbi:MAG: hypothetical protein WCI79_01620 [Candidatus Saccharibacteria bacterium]